MMHRSSRVLLQRRLLAQTLHRKSQGSLTLRDVLWQKKNVQAITEDIMSDARDTVGEAVPAME